MQIGVIVDELREICRHIYLTTNATSRTSLQSRAQQLLYLVVVLEAALQTPAELLRVAFISSALKSQ